MLRRNRLMTAASHRGKFCSARMRCDGAVTMMSRWDGPETAVQDPLVSCALSRPDLGGIDKRGENDVRPLLIAYCFTLHIAVQAG